MISFGSHSLSSVMGSTADSLTGKLTAIRVCAHCEHDRNETLFLQSYARAMKCEEITHGICPEHYQAELLKLKVG